MDRKQKNIITNKKVNVTEHMKNRLEIGAIKQLLRLAMFPEK